MSRTPTMVLILSAGTLASGCGGSSGDSDSKTEVTINAENTIAYSQEAMASLDGMENAGAALAEVMVQFDTVSTGSVGPGGVSKSLMAATEETFECAGGGTVTIETSSESSQEQAARFVADQCIDDTGAMLHGELLVTMGQWDEFSGDFSSFEFTFETGAAGLANDTCQFNGGLVMRFYTAESSDAYGESTFIFEYGSTDEGFIAFCEPDDELNIVADTIVRNELVFTYAQDGSVTSSNTVSIQGGFEAPDGSGYVTVVAEDLEYGVSGNGDSLYGTVMCPTSGQLTITGGDSSTASIYFGDDASAGYAVQVIGPEGFVAEYQTCEAFLAAG